MLRWANLKIGNQIALPYKQGLETVVQKSHPKRKLSSLFPNETFSKYRQNWIVNFANFSAYRRKFEHEFSSETGSWSNFQFFVENLSCWQIAEPNFERTRWAIANWWVELKAGSQHSVGSVTFSYSWAGIQRRGQQVWSVRCFQSTRTIHQQCPEIRQPLLQLFLETVNMAGMLEASLSSSSSRCLSNWRARSTISSANSVSRRSSPSMSCRCFYLLRSSAAAGVGRWRSLRSRAHTRFCCCSKPKCIDWCLWQRNGGQGWRLNSLLSRRRNCLLRWRCNVPPGWRHNDHLRWLHLEYPGWDHFGCTLIKGDVLVWPDGSTPEEKSGGQVENCFSIICQISYSLLYETFMKRN